MTQLPARWAASYWRYEQWLRTCEALCDSPVGVYGGFYTSRRRLAVQQPDGIILERHVSASFQSTSVKDTAL